jgi:hypothetical protein
MFSMGTDRLLDIFTFHVARQESPNSEDSRIDLNAGAGELCKISLSKDTVYQFGYPRDMKLSIRVP